MKFDGFNLLEGSIGINLIIPTGNTHPIDSQEGELFFKSDIQSLMIKGTTSWSIAGDSSSQTLDTISDVNLTSITNQHMLYYDNSQWKNIKAVFELKSLTDVFYDTEYPQVGEMLAWAGGWWVPSSVSSPPTSLNDLSDTIVGATPTTGQFIKYNGSSWVNSTVSLKTNLNSLSGVQILNTPNTGDILRYSGSVWTYYTVSIPTDLDGLSNVVITSPTSGQTLQYVSSNWINVEKPFDISGSILGTPTDDQLLGMLNVTRPFTLVDALTGSQAKAMSIASSSVQIKIQKRSGITTTDIGSINFSAGATNGTFSFPNSISFTIGDKLIFRNQTIADSSFGDATWTLKAKLN